MTKNKPITSKLNKVLRTKFINYVSMLHRRLILQICYYHRCSSVSYFIACVENLRADSIQGLILRFSPESLQGNVSQIRQIQPYLWQ